MNIEQTLNEQIKAVMQGHQARQIELRKQGIWCRCKGDGVYYGFEMGVEGSHPCDCGGK